ncbi:MAG: DUF4394 domain-containing protein [Planctomycetota bacterium]|nr:MAG: DUF4394 domain-containing protein [Planctomycetota bacterium]
MQRLAFGALAASVVLAGFVRAGTPVPSATIYALDARGLRLFSFAAGTPDRLLGSVALSGLAANDTLVAIDFRPSTGELYALGAQSRVYRVDPDSGAATSVGSGPFAPALAGKSFGFDFNPVPDRIRVVSDAEQNLRLHPETGAVAGVDTPLAYATGDANFGANPSVAASAYTSSFAGATSTTLYGIDSALDALVGQGSLGGAPVSPNSGQLFTVGSLGVDAAGIGGFDISVLGGAFAALQPQSGGGSRLFAIDLATGKATSLGDVAGGLRLADIAVRPPSLPRVYGVDASNTLVSFRPGRPGALLSSVAVSGLAAGEQLLGIDFRPATGELYGLGSTSRVYVVDKSSGIASALGTGPFAPLLAGGEFGFDFNPVPDRIRVVSDAEQNLRLNPNTGAVAAVDLPLAYAAGDASVGADPAVTAAAYTQNFAGTSTTALFGIDAAKGALVAQNPPNDGKLNTIGSLGVSPATNAIGFDVSAYGGALATLVPAVGAASSLYSINLNSGAATLVGAVAGVALRDIAIEPPSPPMLVALTAAGTLATFVPGAPGTILSEIALAGLEPGEKLVGIDYRPANGVLYGIGSTSRVYRVALATGIVFPASAASFTPSLAGNAFGLDFNPVPDRIRVVGDAEQNLRLHPETGAVAGVDTPLAYAAGDANFGADPSVGGAAYTNDFAGAVATTLYGIDGALDVLVGQGSLGGAPLSPNSGQLFTLGALGVDSTGAIGFDVSPLGGAFAALVPSGSSGSRLYAVNLATGAATLLGAIGAGSTVVVGLAVVPPGM